VPLVAGEDGWFGEKLAAAGYKKVLDRSIVVRHAAPPTLRGFWDKRIERGRGSPHIWHMRDGWPLARVGRAVLIAVALSLLTLIVPYPALKRGWDTAAYSIRGRRDLLNFICLDWLTTAGNSVGLMRGYLDLRRGGAR
jgi:hypothetical protein